MPPWGCRGRQDAGRRCLRPAVAALMLLCCQLREARAEFFCTAPDPNATSGEHISAATLKHMTNLDHLSKQEMYWLLGIVMYMGGCFSTVIGMNLVRMVHEKRRRAGDAEGSTWGDPVFIIGWFLMVVMTALLDSAAIYFAPIAILAPMSGFTVLINVLVAQKVNNESILPHDILVAIFIVPGILIAIVFGPHDSPAISAQFIRCQATRLSFLLYEALILALFFLAFRASKLMYARPSPEVYEPNVEFARRHTVLSKFRPVTMLLIGGGFGGQQMLFTKLALGALQSTLRHEDGHHNIFLTPYPYICIALLVICTMFQLTFLNRGLAAEGTLVAVPLYNTIFMGFTLSTSAMFNQTFNDMETDHIIFFFFGLACVGTGVLLILKRPVPFDLDIKSEERRPLLDRPESQSSQDVPTSI